jgi:sugar diacid utilization regulator
MVVLAAVDRSDSNSAETSGQRWLADVIGRASGRPQQTAFVVIHDGELIAVLDAHGEADARAVLRRAGAAVQQAGQGPLRAGVGTPFTGLGGFGTSYHEARRALRQSSARRAVVFSPDDVRIFDELLATRDQAVTQLVPDAIRRAIGDASVVATLKAFVDHDLNVADAAKALSLHPNSLRYRLRRITQLTGRDPRRVTDLLELIAATQIVKGPEGF